MYPGRSSNDHASSLSSSKSESPTDPETPFSTASTKVASPSGIVGISIDEDDRSDPCKACLKKSQTHLIEVINYPHLGSRRHRQQVLAQGDYDAILLVYSVGDRASYELIAKLHEEITLRTQHKRRKAVSRKTSGLFSIFTTAHVNGKQAMDAGSEAACEENGSAQVIVAIAGNKCDLDGEMAMARESAGKNQIEDVDYATALFGLRLLRGDQGRSSPMPSMSSNPRQHRHGPTLHLSNGSSETLDKWLQVGEMKETVEVVSPDQEVSVAARRNSSGPQTTVSSGRQVSHVDGEGLALELGTQVPFFETSAKTGENVEELFEAIARVVLNQTARCERNREDLAIKCHHRDVIATTLVQETGSTAGGIAPRLDVPLLAHASASAAEPQSGENGSSMQQAKVSELVPNQTAIDEKQPVEGHRRAEEQCQQIRRRPSILGRMKMFWKKESTVAEGLVV